MITEFKYLPIWTSFARLNEDNKVYIKVSGDLAVPQKEQTSGQSNKPLPQSISPSEKVFKLSKKGK